MSRRKKNRSLQKASASAAATADNIMKILKADESKEWKSGLYIYDSIHLIIPRIIDDAMMQMCGYSGGREYGMLCKVNEHGVLSEDYYIPVQETTSMSIDFTEDTSEMGYNCVIHRHPKGINGFSTVDEEYINSNYDYSLLWTRENGFILGISRQKINGKYVWVDVDMTVQYPFIQGLLTTFREKVLDEDKIAKAVTSVYRSPTTGQSEPYLDVNGKWRVYDYALRKTVDYVHKSQITIFDHYGNEISGTEARTIIADKEAEDKTAKAKADTEAGADITDIEKESDTNSGVAEDNFKETDGWLPEEEVLKNWARTMGFSRKDALEANELVGIVSSESKIHEYDDDEWYNAKHLL